MLDLKNRIIDAASNRGLSASRHVFVTLNNTKTSFRDVRFVVSFTEPNNVTTPLNVLWIVQDPNSADFGKVLRRSSRSSSNGYVHSWSEVTTETGLYINQIWDLPEPEHQQLYDHVALIGNPHATNVDDLNAVSKEGGSLSGPLTTRQLESGEQFDMEEVFPRSFMESSLLPLRQLTSQLRMFFTNLNNQFISLRNRTTVVENRTTEAEQRITAVESSGSGIPKGFSHSQTEEAIVWDIKHDLDSNNLLVQVFQNNKVVWPADIEQVDANNTKISFAVPIVGEARIIPIE